MDSSEDEAPVFKKNLRDPEDVGGSGTFARKNTWGCHGLSKKAEIITAKSPGSSSFSP